MEQISPKFISSQVPTQEEHRPLRQNKLKDILYRQNTQKKKKKTHTPHT